MNLYAALQTIYGKIEENSANAGYQTEKEMLKAILENQVRAAEAMLILGSLLHTIAGRDVEIEVRPPKGSSKH
jgi:hypothetical protein